MARYAGSERYHSDMDTLLTSGEAARSLNTSVSRVLRAARAGVVRTTRRGNRTLFDQSAVDQLRALWGQVSAQPGLSREDMQVLAALSRRPRGLRSVRAVARASGLSPTTAGRALARLAEKGYVARKKVRATEGRVLDVTVWVIRWASAEWLAVAAAVGSVVLPEKAGKADRPVSARPRGRRVPSRLAHLFWNEDLALLDVDRDAVLLASRILRSDDPEAHAWMMRALPRAAILRAARARSLDPRRARFGQLLAGQATP